MNSIPNQVHFIWIGSGFPWLYYLSILSAVNNGAFDKVFVHYTELGLDEKWFSLLSGLDDVIVKEMDFDVLFPSSDIMLKKLGMQRTLIDNNPVIQTNLLRYAILYLYGGIYLDFDVFVLRSFQSILKTIRTSFFAGEEKILFPEYIIHPSGIKNRFLKFRSRIIAQYRNLCKWIPHGYLLFKSRKLYIPTVNQAILGSERRSMFITKTIEHLNSFSAADLNTYLKTGPFLFQKIVNCPDLHTHVEVLPTYCFYPVPPEMTKHIFRSYRRFDINKFYNLDSSYTLHWYSSTFRRSKVRINEIDDISLKTRFNFPILESILSKYITKKL